MDIIKNSKTKLNQNNKPTMQKNMCLINSWLCMEWIRTIVKCLLRFAFQNCLSLELKFLVFMSLCVTYVLPKIYHGYELIISKPRLGGNSKPLLKTFLNMGSQNICQIDF